MDHGGPASSDRLDAVAEALPFSPLSGLGTFLGTLVVLRSWADPAGTVTDLLVSALPLATCAGVVAADRWLLADGVGARDRFTVTAYALGGFLTAWIITGVQVPLLVDDAGSVGDRLFLMLVGGTVGVAAGTVGGAAEIRQRQAVRQAERERERLEEFASVVSHDLRNPLEVARGYLVKAFETGDPDHLLRVRNALDRMNELIEDSLALARQGAVVDETEAVDVAAGAAAAGNTVGTAAAARATDEGVVVEADEARLRELLENLFRNSVEHGTREGEGPETSGSSVPAATPTADGGPSLTITVGGLDGDGFYVADDGVGIPDDERDAVFDRGHTTAEGGSGLGLAIVATIAEAHGWTIEAVESDAGGARFEVRV
jgi:signal transduction histidine kinase